ncbi:hypothetical protein MTO96_043466 [Rhipicephalus appendiculatus]
MSFKAGKRGVGVVLLTASVEAGQQLSKTYRPWCIVKDDGTVVNAHCTCMAGRHQSVKYNFSSQSLDKFLNLSDGNKRLSRHGAPIRCTPSSSRSR